MMTAEQFQEKHNRRLKGALEDMKAGIERVTVSPTAQAADKQAKMKARLMAAIDDGSWARGLKKVTLEDWRSKMLDKGLSRVSGGIDAAAEKVKDFASQLLPAIATQQAAISKMPDLTLDDNISRMTTFVRGMSKFRKS